MLPSSSEVWMEVWTAHLAPSPAWEWGGLHRLGQVRSHTYFPEDKQSPALSQATVAVSGRTGRGKHLLEVAQAGGLVEPLRERPEIGTRSKATL